MQQVEVTHHGAPASTDKRSFSSGSGGGGVAPSSQFHPIDPLRQQQAEKFPPAATSSSDELAPAVLQAEKFPDDGGATGNRWPRQETLALLKIRSEMDAAFRDATLKGPLWDEVSKKLAELGYKRSSKKCREKFENVHKYYKRTKDIRAGRPDGKSYRFFNQLEALKAAAGGGLASTMATPEAPLAAPSPVIISFSSEVGATGQTIPRVQPLPISAAAPPAMIAPARGLKGISGSIGAAAAFAGVSFSSDSSSSVSASDSDEEVTEEAGRSQEGRKRKRCGSSSGDGGGSSSSQKAMAFFEGLMKQVMERQEVMQLQLLETMEKGEEDRMIREEAWRLQEVARLSREQELLAQERTMAASRDAILIRYLEKITGQSTPSPATPFVSTICATMTVIPHPQLLPSPPVSVTTAPAPAPPMPVQPLQQYPPPPPRKKQLEIGQKLLLPALELVGPPETRDTGGDADSLEPTSSSRWPKTEVHSLIKIRSGIESMYHHATPKGPLWEEISAGMRRLGYNRSAKKCKEKWENINKYFKKVKLSDKRRPEDAKSCPYFHQLDALYRKKSLGCASAVGSIVAVQDHHHQQQQQQQQEQAAILNPHPQAVNHIPPTTAAPPQASPQGQQLPPDTAAGQNGSNSNSISNVNSESGGGSGGDGQVIQCSNGGIPELTRQQHQMDNYDKMEEATDSDDLNQEFDEDEDEDDDEEKKMQYKIQLSEAADVGNAGSRWR